MMGSFEWMELQSLVSEIAGSRSRLAAARRGKDHRLVRTLEQEITAAEERRTDLLAHISTHLADTPEAAAEPGARKSAAAARRAAAAAANPDDEQDLPPLDLVNPIIDAATTAPDAAARHDSPKGERIVWDQLTASDVERARQELEARRAKMIARHAEELKGLDADHSELSALERAIDAFMQKFNGSEVDGGVVKLGEERGTRLQSRA